MDVLGQKGNGYVYCRHRTKQTK